MEITDLTVVTGQWRGSGDGGPVLPAVTRAFLTEEMVPPLEVREVRDNMGRIVVTGESIEAWVSARDRDRDQDRDRDRDQDQDLEEGGRSGQGEPSTTDR